jgi:hypothetical protein
MPKFIATSSFAASAAVLGITFAALLASAAPQAKAEPQIASVVQPPLTQPLAKADDLPIQVKGAACSSHSWPDYDQDCRFDLRSPAKPVQMVRVIALR